MHDREDDVVFNTNDVKVESFETQFSKMGLSTNARRSSVGFISVRYDQVKNSSSIGGLLARPPSQGRKSVSTSNQEQQSPIVYPQSISSGTARSRQKKENRVHWQVVSPELQVPLKLESISVESTLLEEVGASAICPSPSEAPPKATQSQEFLKQEHSRDSTRRAFQESTESTKAKLGSDNPRTRCDDAIPYQVPSNLKHLPPSAVSNGTAMSKRGSSSESHLSGGKLYGRDMEVRTMASSNLTRPNTRSRLVANSAPQVLYEVKELHGYEVLDLYDSDRNLVVHFMRSYRRIHGTDYMTWTVSEANHPLKCLDIPNVEPGHVHFHFNRITNGAQIWMLHGDYYWREHSDSYAQPNSDIRHPVHCLYLTTYGNNSWLPNFVKWETLNKRTYPLPIAKAFSSSTPSNIT